MFARTIRLLEPNVMKRVVIRNASKATNPLRAQEDSSTWQPEMVI